MSASLYRNLPYDAITSFTPISLLSVSPLILSVHPRVKAATMKELIDLAKAKPGSLNFATSGSGTSPHLAAELFRMGAEVDIVHVPFKGNGPALTALLGGQVDFQFTDVASISHLQSGKLRALAVTTAKRSASLPEVPTVAEAGIPGYETSNWFALLAPAGTPREIVSRVHASVVAALRSPAVRERYQAQGFDLIGSSPEELGAFLRTEVAKYARAISAAGIKVD
ncbi:MAG: tripartite tricarboxylate transporter substrate binding protein [Betaproteobacteria bacterium]|nr:tripartite tricarboxylate transporter substrate binding protein [Betaproteobacteria bacterium]